MAMERVCAVADISAEEAFAVIVDGIEIAVARDGDGTDVQVFAVQDRCSHQDVPLTEGEVDGCQIECFLHGSRFDLHSGKPTGPPAIDPISTFPVEVRDGSDGPEVYVDVSTTLNGVAPTL